MLASLRMVLRSTNENFKNCKKKNERHREAQLLKNIAADFELRGQLQNALIYYQRSLAIYKSGMLVSGDRNIEWQTGSQVANAIGLIHQALGESEQALTAYQQALAIDRRAQNLGSEANTLSNIGIVYRTSERTDRALESYKKAISLYQELDENHYQIPKILNRIGLIYQEQGRFELALSAYQRGLDILTNSRSLEQVSDRILTIENISNLYRIQGLEERAVAIIAETFDNLTIEKEPYSIALAFERVGVFYLSEQQFERASSYFERALIFSRQSSNQGYAEIDILNSISIAYSKQQQFERALPYQQRIADVFQEMGILENTATALRHLAEFYQTLEQFDRALTSYQKALEAYQEIQQKYEGKTIDIARIFWQIGCVYETQGQLKQAVASYHQALAQYQKSNVPQGQILVLERLASLLKRQGQVNLARQFSQQAEILRDSIHLNWTRDR